MTIQKSKRKPGIYAQWFEVVGLNNNGHRTIFLIYSNQAKTYAQAEKFWNKMWGKDCTAFYLRNAEPFSEHLLLAC